MYKGQSLRLPFKLKNYSMEESKNMHNRESMSYKKFMTMMIISFLIMYTVMFLNMDKLQHYHTSITRIYMALLMVAPMAVVMMRMMGKMYPNKTLTTTIIVAAIIVFAITLTGLRTQTPIGDVQYMKAMIPHHSSAILTSKNADIKDPEVKKMSEQIIQAQEKEIAEMEAMLDRLSK
jgi:uncharacterized protein (DUF305 family)